MNRLYILNGTLVAADSVIREDLLIEDGIITGIGDFQSRTSGVCRVIDATGKLILPGGFDPHVHFALPTPAGPSCDDFESGSMAALQGGTTFFMDFVTPRRGETLHDALDARREEAKASVIPFGLHMGISEWNPSVASEIQPLIEKEGIRSFKAYLAYRDTIGIGACDLVELMRIAGSAGAVVMVHCEDGLMIARRQQELLGEGKARPAFHAMARPPEAEIRAISEVIDAAARTGCTVYIVHISTRAGAERVAQAKRSGIRVYGETCPHYLLMDDSVYGLSRDDRDVLPFVLSPPIRSRADQEGLWEALADGTIDTVATDHCPFNIKGQKDRGIGDFTKIPNGAGGVEHRLTLLYTYGVMAGRISLERFVDAVSTKPAEIFGYGQQQGKLLPGFDGNIVIWDPDSHNIISAETHLSRCDHDIYEGIPVRGKPVSVGQYLV